MSCSTATGRSSSTAGTSARSTGSSSSTGAIEAIAALNEAGIPVAVVTNQAGVARGYYGIEDVAPVHKHMIAELARQGAHVDLWLFCPYHPDGVVEGFARSSADRKPAPGMALAAARALDLDLTRRGSSATAPATSGWPGRSARDRSTSGRPTPGADVPSFPDLAAAVESHPRRTTRRETGGAGGRRSPDRFVPVGDLFGGAYSASSPAPSRTIDLAQLAGAADLLVRRLRRATPRSSPAATAGRPPSPTTCSATTSRACATART